MEQEQPIDNKPMIFCDMDGVLCDFDTQLISLTHNELSANEYEEKYGKNQFWDIIKKAGSEFWATMPWKPDGKDLWKYIRKYNPRILSAPTQDDSSILGKVEWLKRNIPELNPENYTTSLRRIGNERVILNSNKYMAVLHDPILKNLAGEIKTRGRRGEDVSDMQKMFDIRRKLFILIDDTPKKIQAWTDAGGTGVLHTSTNDTIVQLRNVLKEVGYGG